MLSLSKRWQPLQIIPDMLYAKHIGRSEPLTGMEQQASFHASLGKVMPTMSEPERIGDLEIHQDLPHERREWIIERIGWVVMGLLLIAASVGLLGPGPLSSATAGGAGSSLRAEYDRFERNQAPSMLRVHLGQGASRDGKARLWLNREFVENVEIHLIAPQPESVEVGPDRFVYTFNTRGTDDATAVIFHLEANRFGPMPVRVGLDGGPELQFSQFIYP